VTRSAEEKGHDPRRLMVGGRVPWSAAAAVVALAQLGRFDPEAPYLGTVNSELAWLRGGGCPLGARYCR
jgi:hypothetical protein